MRKFLSLLVLVFLAVPAWADPLEKVAKKLSDGAKKLKNARVAVLPFPYHDGRQSKGSTIISERLTTDLVEINKLEVIERSLIENVFKELKLESSGAVDGESAKKIGKILGVEAIVNGTLIDLDDQEVEVNARLILVESGEIVAAGSVNVEKQWADEDPEAEDESEMARASPDPKTAVPASPQNIPEPYDDGPGFERLPAETFLIESDFTPEVVRTPFGEEFVEGMNLIQSGNAQAGEDHFKKMIRKLSDNPRRKALASLGLSLSLFAQRERHESLNIAEDLAGQKQFPRLSLAARYVLGKYYEAEDRKDDALNEYRAVVRGAPFQTLLVRSAARRLDALSFNRKEARKKSRLLRKELRRTFR